MSSTAVLVWNSANAASFTSVSENWTAYTGQPSEALIPHAWWQVLHPDDRFPVQQAFDDAWREQRHFAIPCRLQRHDGHYGRFLMTGIAQNDGSYIGTFTDMALCTISEPSTLALPDRRRREEHNAHLRDFAGELAGTETAEEIGEIVVEAGLYMTGGGLSSVWLVTPDGQFIERLHAAGLDEAHLREHPRLPLDESTAMGYAIKHKEVVWIETQDEFIRRNPAWEALIREQDLHSVLCLPFFGKDGSATGGMYVAYAGAPKRLTAEERSFFLAMAQICAAALERSRLAEQARELAATRERHRLAHSLHDSVSQTLFAASVHIDALPQRWPGNGDEPNPEVEHLRRLTRGAMAEMRALQLELRPERLSRYSLAHLLRQLTDALQARKEIELHVELNGDPDVPPRVKEAMYRIAQEIFNNIIRHSRATHIFLELHAGPEAVELLVRDNGHGFRTDETLNGVGLETMQARALAVNADLVIESQVGVGTSVRLGWKKNQ